MIFTNIENNLEMTLNTLCASLYLENNIFNVPSNRISQVKFLEKFFPEISILRPIAETVVYTNSRRSRLFSKNFNANTTQLYSDFKANFSRELWNIALETTDATISNDFSDDKFPILDQWTNDVINTINTYVPSDSKTKLLSLTVTERLAAIVMLVFVDSIKYEDKDIQTLVLNIIDLIISCDKDTEDTSNKIIERGDIKYIYFGKYPQTVADESTARALDEINPNNGIYTYEGNSYIKHEANLRSLNKTNASRFVFSNGTPIKNGHSYYFKLEPIKWRLLEENDDSYLLLTDRIIEHYFYKKTIHKTAIYYSGKSLANDWEHSDMNYKLNEDYDGFFNTAFNKEEKGKIKEVSLDNNAEWSNSKVSTHKVFLLSYDEANQYILNFNEKEKSIQDVLSKKRIDDIKACLNSIAFITDFAICRGVCPYSLQSYINYYKNDETSKHNTISLEHIKKELISNGRCNADEFLKNGIWWLRTPGNKESRYRGFDEETDYTRRVCDIMEDGHLCTRGSVVDDGSCNDEEFEALDGIKNGVRPALYLKKNQ